MEESQKQGYVTDVEYVDGYYSNLEPVLLSYIAGINGLKHNPKLKDYSYCELGCGNGLSLNLLADANSDSQFYGVDFNAVHTKHAQKQAELAGLDNVHYLQENFDNLLDIELPEFDYITLHGVYSWISPELRRHILRFIQKKLKPGGLVMVSYNTLPGWSVFMPLRDMMRTYTSAMDIDVLEKAKHGIAYLDFLNKKEAPFFKLNPMAGTMVESLKKKDLRYVVHEYFNEHWNPLYFSQVNSEMCTASLTFAGSFEIPLNYSDMSFPPAFKDEIAQITDRTSLEIHRSFINNERFRRDVYYKPTGRAQDEAPDGFQFMDAFTYTSLLDSEHFQYHTKLITGTLQLQGDLFKPLVKQLSQQIHTLDTLVEASSLIRFSREEVCQGLQRLMTTGQIKLGVKGRIPLQDEMAENPTLQFQSSFNQMNYEQYEKRRAQQHCFSSPVLGVGLQLGAWELAAVRALKTGSLEQGVDLLLQDFRARGEVAVDRKGNSLTDRNKEKAFVIQEVKMFEKYSLPVLKRLGIF